MPAMDGIEMAARIRELDGGTKVKIAAISASADTTERARVLAANMDDFLRKPYRASEVFECLSQHLGVKYIVNDHVPALAFRCAVNNLTAEDFAVLPEELRAELAQAVISLDLLRVTAVIEVVVEYDSVLASRLSFHMERLSFGPILLRTLRRTEIIALLRTNGQSSATRTYSTLTGRQRTNLKIPKRLTPFPGSP